VKNNCIVSQVHIPPFDPQGNLVAEQKKHILDISISHMRKWNPDSYIILTGHGEEPKKSTIDKCDHVHWEPLRPMDLGGTVIGMPAQYYFVSKGVKHAKEQGFDYCLKTRGDSVVCLPNVVEYCHDVITSEEKKILLTQQTGDSLYKMGDCFMYGEIDLLDGMWDLNNEVFHADGLRNTGANFIKHFSGELPPQQFSNTDKYFNDLSWNEMLKEYCSFRDIFKLKFIDLRWNYVKAYHEKNLDKIVDNDFPFNEYLWGRSNGWHIFNDEGKLVSQAGICSWSYDEKSFYKR
tara:strand:- start:4500 stop:5372 length:873 start_codon:yes stop_codon:yes gene_type:complete